MKQVIPVKTKSVSIDELVEQLQMGENLIVFYRTNNKRDGIPVFLCRSHSGVYFRSPIIGLNPNYFSTNFRNTITECSKNREVFVLNKDESDQLFKIGAKTE